MPHRVFGVADFISEVKHSAALEAKEKNCGLKVGPVSPDLAVDADRDLLSSAVSNLLQNAFKFTEPRTAVRLNAYAIGNRVLIDVEDHCGGLHDTSPEKIFLPFVCAGRDSTGLGLGLSLSRRSVELFDGSLTVKDLPGTGCVFTVNLPRHSLPETTMSGFSAEPFLAD